MERGDLSQGVAAGRAADTDDDVTHLHKDPATPHAVAAKIGPSFVPARATAHNENQTCGSTVANQ
jgi:hypothetical protein